MRDTFKVFCAGGAEMDSKAFVKLCKRCCLLDPKFTPHDARLVFSAAVPISKARMDLEGFEHALVHVAAKRGLDQGLVRRMVSWYEAPAAEGAEAEPGTEKHANTWSHDATAPPRTDIALASPTSGESLAPSRRRAGSEGMLRSGSLPCVGRLRPHMVDGARTGAGAELATPSARGRGRREVVLSPERSQDTLLKDKPGRRPRSLSSATTCSSASAPGAVSVSPAFGGGGTKGAGVQLDPRSLGLSAGGSVFDFPRSSGGVGHAVGPAMMPLQISMPLQTLLPGNMMPMIGTI